MSIDELRGQISVLLRKIDLLERQGIERETEVLKMKEEVQGLRRHNAELLEKLQPPGKRERALVARLSSLAEYAESIQRGILGAPPRGVPGGPALAARENGGRAAPALPPPPSRVAPVLRGRALTPAPAPPAVLWGARWEPPVAGPERMVTMRVHAPGFGDGTVATVIVGDDEGDRDEIHDTTVQAEEVAVEWVTPRVAGRYTFRAEVGGKIATASWLYVADGSSEGADPARVNRLEGEVRDGSTAAGAVAAEDVAETSATSIAEPEAPPASPIAAPEAPPASPVRASREADGERAPARGDIAEPPEEEHDDAHAASEPDDDHDREITTDNPLREPPTIASIELPADFSRVPAAPPPALPTDPPTHIFVSVPPGVRSCWSCKAPMKPDGRFCEKCGHDSETDPPPRA